MASAQAMEEELQQSVLLSQDSEWALDASNSNTKAHLANKSIKATNTRQPRRMEQDEDEDDRESDRDASGEEVEEDAEGEEEFDLGSPPAETEAQNDSQDDEEDEAEEDQDAEGEEDVEVEGVGAVKMRPSDSDADMDGSSDVSELPSGADDESDEEAAWEDARDMAEDDDDSDTAPSNICIFCKQDEENDPSEDFEAFLMCTRCGENAHQQCARDAASMSEHNDAKNWKCPECYTDESEADDDAEDLGSAADARPISQQSNVPKLTRDLLAAKTGSEDGDSHSIFNELVLDEDPMNGSRLLRKRKTSSLDPDETVVALRKRRRNSSAEPDEEGGDGAGSPDAAGSRSARTLRLKVSHPPPVTIEKHSRTSLVLKLRVRPGNLKEILARKKRDRKRTGGNSSRPSRPAPQPPARASNTPVPMIETPFTADSYSQPFYSFFDRDTDDAKGKPYGGILTDGEADTSKTLPMTEDRRRFDQAKQKADDEWRARVLAMQAEAEVPVRRPKKTNDHASQIECIEFGGWEIDTWYAAPYPAEYSRNRVLYICEFCLKYMNSDYVAWRHKLKCPAKHPPGDEIYRHGSISFFEVDGRKNPVYCQNLCLLAKLFLGSKTLYYDVEPFLFYVLCEFDECGYHFVGYFSKEKRPSSQNNVSCILTLPIHQRKGYGNLLIDFSYLLTKVEEKTGSPEKPLSDLGLVSYRSYWRLVLCRYLLEAMEKGGSKAEGLSIKQISEDTAMTPDDVIAGLEGLRALVRDPQTKLYAFRVDLDFCRQYVKNWESKGHVKLKPEALAWTPYVMGRGNAANLELGPINTIAPREEEEAKLDEGNKGVGPETQAMMNGVRKAAVSAAPDTALEAEEAADQLKPEATSQSDKDKVVEDDKENVTPGSDCAEKMDVDPKESWDTPYQAIPPSRFEIFPPISGGRRTDRARQSVSRPALARTTSSAPRPRPKRPGGGSARRPTAPRPKSNSSKRKSGGTGRGPGRWPKGTKKSDYGNADSGPGFPPGWLERQMQLKGGPEAIKAAKEAGLTQEEVQVLMPLPDTIGASAVSVNGNGSDIKVFRGQDDNDDNAEDVDAEGEDA